MRDLVRKYWVRSLKLRNIVISDTCDIERRQGDSRREIGSGEIGSHLWLKNIGISDVGDLDLKQGDSGREIGSGDIGSDLWLRNIGISEIGQNYRCSI